MRSFDDSKNVHVHGISPERTPSISNSRSSAKGKVSFEIQNLVPFLGYLSTLHMKSLRETIINNYPIGWAEPAHQSQMYNATLHHFLSYLLCILQFLVSPRWNVTHMPSRTSPSHFSHETLKLENREWPRNEATLSSLRVRVYFTRLDWLYIIIPQFLTLYMYTTTVILTGGWCWAG